MSQSCFLRFKRSSLPRGGKLFKSQEVNKTHKSQEEIKSAEGALGTWEGWGGAVFTRSHPYISHGKYWEEGTPQPAEGAPGIELLGTVTHAPVQ